MKLFLKAERCYSEKCAFDRRPYPSGQHGQRRSKLTEYGLRLREKQKVRRVYGVLERQFRRYFEMAENTKGVTGENLLNVLERRLDTACYRMGFASTRSEARQLVLHKHVLVNGKVVNIPSFLVKPGDTITIHERSRSMARIASALEAAERRGLPEWVEIDKEKFSATVKALPSRDDIALPIQEQLIVEFYSR
jgi:small subunit ribosomal protein S4